MVITPNICWFCPVLINSVLLNLLRVCTFMLLFFHLPQLACNVQSFSDADNPMSYMCRGVHGDLQVKLLYSYVRQKEHEGDFAGVFPVHACLNHSCANNAFVCDGKTADGRPGCHVKAKRDITAGEEVRAGVGWRGVGGGERELRTQNFITQG